MQAAHTVLEYLYRDAGNYKSWGSVLLLGSITSDEEATLRSCLEPDNLFVAEQVDLPVLYEALWSLNGGRNDDDHAYHELNLFRPASIEEVACLTPWGNTCDLIRMFQNVQGRWDCRLSPNCSWH